MIRRISLRLKAKYNGGLTKREWDDQYKLESNKQ